MLRSAALLLALLAVAGCDVFGPDTDRFVGVWEGRAGWETTVTSATNQPYAGTERNVRGVGGIEVRGAVETTMRYFAMAGPGTVQVEDGRGFALFLQGDEGYVANNPADEAERVFLPFDGAAYSADGRTVAVPEATYTTDAGPLTLDGTLAARSMELQAGVPATLPFYEGFAGLPGTLTIAPDGTYTSAAFGQTPTTGTWDVDGDDLVLRAGGEGEGSRYTLADGELVAVGREDQPADTRDVERRRGLAAGSLTSATQTFTIRYERAE